MKWKKINGMRLTYELELDGLPAYNLTRFGTYEAPFISQGDRDKDRREYDEWLFEEHGLTRSQLGDVKLHHHIDGRMMLIPSHIHKIKHLGFIGAKKALSFILRGSLTLDYLLRIKWNM